MSNTYRELKYHAIIRVWDEKPLLTERHQDGLCRYIPGIVRNHAGRALRIAALPDHLHLLLGIPAYTTVADMLRLIKANSSKWLNMHGDGRGWFCWQPGYAAFTVSPAQVAEVLMFIINQEESHRQRSLDHEYRRIIEKHGLDFAGDAFGRQRDTHAWLGFHLVFRVKHSMQLITSARKQRLYRKLAELVAEKQGRLLEVGGMPDHVHLLAEIPRTVTVANFLQRIKSISSPQLDQDDGPFSPFGWQRGYGAFAVSRSQVPVVARYIQRQEEHHRGMSFEEELRRLRAEHDLTPQIPGIAP